ncbi:hypothetical protein [Echinicola arenosa]|nr:hypothetical protein [Echinicola arenosa]
MIVARMIEKRIKMKVRYAMLFQVSSKAVTWNSINREPPDSH